jgi:hypothetical protein
MPEMHPRFDQFINQGICHVRLCSSSGLGKWRFIVGIMLRVMRPPHAEREEYYAAATGRNLRASQNLKWDRDLSLAETLGKAVRTP